MAKGIYVGVGGVARKVKKIYIGVSGVARKVKKAYVGVGGAARLFFSAGLSYGGTVSTAIARTSCNVTTAGNYAIIAGGSANSTIEAYNSSLVLTYGPTDYYDDDRPLTGIGATTISNYALLVDGREYGSSTGDATKYTVDFVRVISPSLVKTILRNGDLQDGRTNALCASNGSCAVIGPGVQWFHSNASDGSNRDKSRSYINVMVYNTSLTRVRSFEPGGSDSYCEYAMAPAGLTGPIIISGGETSSNHTDAGTYAVNSDGTTTGIVTYASNGRQLLGGASNDTYAIFAGGMYHGEDGTSTHNHSDAIAYNSSLVSISAPDLSVGREYMSSGGSTPEFAVFAGGYINNGTSLNTMDIYDRNLVRSNEITFPIASYNLNNVTRFGDKLLYPVGSTIYLFDF
ncbi:MAG: hypothetical protein WCD89_22780 [Anaerocolumna sp.]